jgi:hypothetical protein
MSEILDTLLEEFYPEEIRHEALKYLQNYLPIDDDDSVWVSDAVNAWCHWELDEDLFSYFGKAVKHLLPNTEEPLQR